MWKSYTNFYKTHNNNIQIIDPKEQARKLFNFTVIQVGKTREAIGLDGEVVNRRRTISGPVSELVEAARREQPTPLDFAPSSAQPQPQSQSPPPLVNSSSPHPPSSPVPCSGGSGSSLENLPFAEEGSLTIRRQARGEGEGQVTI